MSTYESDQVRAWIGHTAYGSDGEKIGKVEDVYEDHVGSGPEWFAISTGWFGSKQTFAPVAGATADGDRLILPYTKDAAARRAELRHGLVDGRVRLGPPVRPLRHVLGGADDDDRHRGRWTVDGDAGRDDAMTRSEEELNVSTRQREAGRARLRKWVETEQRSVTVPVRREVARLVSEPITDTNVGQAMDGPEIRENEYDVVLHEEEVVVDKQVVPKERVRLETDTVEEERVVEDTVRKERIGMDADGTGQTGLSDR